MLRSLRNTGESPRYRDQERVKVHDPQAQSVAMVLIGGGMLALFAAAGPGADLAFEDNLVFFY